MPETITLVGLIRAAPPANVLAAARARGTLGGRSRACRSSSAARRSPSGGVLLLAPRGADVESVARELHERTGRPCRRVRARGVRGRRSGPARSPAVRRAACRRSRRSRVGGADSRIAAACGGTSVSERRDGYARVRAGAHRARCARRRGADRRRAGADRHPLDGAAVRRARHRGRRPGGPLSRRPATAGSPRRASICRRSRERAEDVPAAGRAAARGLVRRGRRARRAAFTQPALALLSALTWPGNLAELQLVIERAATDAPHDVIQIEDVLPALKLDTLERPESARPLRPVGQPARRAARASSATTSPACCSTTAGGWREAAHALGIQRPNLYRKARQLGIPLARTSE